MQQRGHRFDVRVAHAPAPRCAIQQHIGDGDDAHALVVGHESVDAGETDGGGLAGGAEVERFDEAVARARGQRLQHSEVFDRAVRCDLRRERGGVRRDHQFVGWCAAQREAWHALRCVLVGERVVTGGVGRLRDAPGHVVFVCEPDLLVQRGEAGAVQHAAMRFVEHQRGHQVLEHRARPGAQASVRADRIKRPAEGGPVADRYVALGDREQAGQARLRSEQVVETRIELLLGNAVADVKETAFAVVQKTEVGLPGQHFTARGNGLQAPHRVVADHRGGAGRRALRPGLGLCVEQRTAQRGDVVGDPPSELVQRGGRERRVVTGQQRYELFGGFAQQGFERFGWIRQGVAQRQQTHEGAVRQRADGGGAQRLDARHRGRQRTLCPRRAERLTCKLGAGLRHGEQGTGKVAAVDRRHIHRQQRRFVLGVVPVQEVTAVARHLGQRLQCGLEPCQQVLRADPAELARAGSAQHVQADVGRRSAVRDQRLRGELQVVGRQVVVFGADAALEQSPGVARVVFEVGLIECRQRRTAARGARPADPPGPQR